MAMLPQQHALLTQIKYKMRKLKHSFHVVKQVNEWYNIGKV